MCSHRASSWRRPSCSAVGVDEGVDAAGLTVSDEATRDVHVLVGGVAVETGADVEPVVDVLKDLDDPAELTVPLVQRPGELLGGATLPALGGEVRLDLLDALAHALDVLRGVLAVACRGCQLGGTRPVQCHWTSKSKWRCRLRGRPTRTCPNPPLNNINWHGSQHQPLDSQKPQITDLSR